MKHYLKYKLLGVPLLVWGLQLLYVALLLGLLAVLMIGTNLNNRPLSTKLLVVIPYIVAMIAIDIAWRIAIKKHLQGWF